jgi:hypothetical protein
MAKAPEMFQFFLPYCENFICQPIFASARSARQSANVAEASRHTDNRLGSVVGIRSVAGVGAGEEAEDIQPTERRQPGLPRSSGRSRLQS